MPDMGGALRLVLVLALLAVTAMPALVPKPASACSCVSGVPLQTQFDEADAVLAGRVTAIDGQPYNGSHFSIRVAATRVWKGPAQSDVTVATADSGGAACAYDFVLGNEYVIFAHEWDGRLDVNSCGATHPGVPTPAELALFGAELPLDERPVGAPSSNDGLSSTSSALHLVLIFGAPLMLVAVAAVAVVWWRTSRP